MNRCITSLTSGSRIYIYRKNDVVFVNSDKTYGVQSYAEYDAYVHLRTIKIYTALNQLFCEVASVVNQYHNMVIALKKY